MAGADGASAAAEGGTAAEGDGTAGSGDGDSGEPPPPLEMGEYLPARIVRLGLGEYERSVVALLDHGQGVVGGFVAASDARQSGYTRADSQVVGNMLAQDLFDAAEDLAAQAVADIGTILPCDPVALGEDECAREFIDTFGASAYRRPLTDEEATAIFGLYTRSRDVGGFEAGIEDVIAAVLQSASFLYRTELGPDGPGQNVRLDDFEAAAELSYLVTVVPRRDVDGLALSGTSTRRRARNRHAGCSQRTSGRPSSPGSSWNGPGWTV